MILVIQAIILSVIQGISEWFPISSSGHLAIFQEIFGFQNLAFDVFLHFASILAVIIVFRKDIIKLFNFKNRKNLSYIGLLIIALIPAGILGFMYGDVIEGVFSNLIYIGIFFIISGVLIYSTRFAKQKKEELDFLDSVFIGLLQAFALFPGVSRSGSTISAGLFNGLKKEYAVKFSFLLAIPIVLGAGVLKLKDLAFSDISYGLLIASFIITFIVSLFTIKVLLKIIKGDRFYLFGFYNLLIGILVLIWGLVR
jgi:undecaprenyl-diphosphatase